MIVRRNENAEKLDDRPLPLGDPIRLILEGRLAHLSRTSQKGFDDPALAKFNVPAYQEIVAMVKDGDPVDAGDGDTSMDVSEEAGISGIGGKQMSVVIKDTRAEEQTEQNAVNDIAEGLLERETKQGGLGPASKNIISISEDLLGSINKRTRRITETMGLLKGRKGLTDATERMRTQLISKMETGMRNLNEMSDSLVRIIDSARRSSDAEKSRSDMDTVLELCDRFKSTELPSDLGLRQANTLLTDRVAWPTAPAGKPAEQRVDAPSKPSGRRRNRRR